ncbi:hypothetical protein Tco_0393894 [Tanacetum coccineum]
MNHLRRIKGIGGLAQNVLQPQSRLESEIRPNFNGDVFAQFPIGLELIDRKFECHARLESRSDVNAFPRLKNGIRLMLAPRSANAKHIYHSSWEIHKESGAKPSGLKKREFVIGSGPTGGCGWCVPVPEVGSRCMGAGAGEQNAWFFLSKSNARTILSSAYASDETAWVEASYLTWRKKLP